MDKINLRDASEIDVILDCKCGTSFYVYLPDTPYACPDCGRLYVVELNARLTDDVENWRIVGVKADE